MKITQIFSDSKSILGLGEDNKVYEWSFTKGEWEPHWKVSGPQVQQPPASDASAASSAV